MLGGRWTRRGRRGGGGGLLSALYGDLNGPKKLWSEREKLWGGGGEEEETKSHFYGVGRNGILMSQHPPTHELKVELVARRLQCFDGVFSRIFLRINRRRKNVAPTSLPSYPTTNGGMQNGSSVGILHTHCTHIFAHLVPICMLSRSLLTEVLHRNSVGSLLRVRCWLGTHT